VSAATTDGGAAQAGPAQRAGRPGPGPARPRVAARVDGVAVTSARARPRGARAGAGLVPGPGRNRRVSLAWPRLPAAAEVAIVAAGYAGYALVRLAVRASRPAAIAHAAGLWRAERWLHAGIEPSLNQLAAARPVLAETAGYYYGLAHFIVTPLVLAWLWLRRPGSFGPLRSALVLATTAANVVFWTWPVAPPRFAVPGLADVLARYRILGAGSPHGPERLVNLYAAMPSLHVAWAAWCAVAIVAATRGRWRHLAWLYPAATTLDVLATANHFVLDAVAGLAVTALGLLAARATARPDATGPGPGGAGRAAALGPGAAPRRRRPVIRGRVARRWAWAAGGAAAVLIALRAPAARADVRAALAHGLRLPWLGAAAAAEAVVVAGLVLAQRQLLAAAGARLPVRAVAAAVVASTGLARLLPAGPAAAAAWQAGQYRRRDPASGTAGAWAVLAGGVASAAAALAGLAAGAAAAARWPLLAGGAATLAATAAAALAARRAGGAARWLARHAGRSRWRRRLAVGLAGLAQPRLGPRRGAAVLAASGLSVLGEAGLLAAAFEVAGLPVPWRGLLLAGAAGQLGARLVPLPGGLGGVEGGVLGALALTGTRPATALAAVIVYRVAGYWAPGAAGAVTAAVLTRRHPARAARPVTALRPQAPPRPVPGQPARPRQAASPAGARAARPWPAPGRPARPGIKPARAHPRACPGGRTPQTAAGHAASARSPPEPGRPVPPPGTAAAPRPVPARHQRRGATVIARRRNEEKKGTCHEHPANPPSGRQRCVRGGHSGRHGRPGRRGRCGRVPAAGHLARRRRPGRRRARHADRAVGRHLAVGHHPAVRRRQRRRRQPDLRAGGGRHGRLRPGRPARVRRPAGRQRAARRLADYRGADPQPQAPHRRLDVLVQQLGRRGADRPGRRQPGRRRPAAAGPPLTTRTVRVLTASQDPHPGSPDGRPPRDPRRGQSRSSGACYEP
jgi:uncharacterized membrane protein YbhN (UPF0104 family)